MKIFFHTSASEDLISGYYFYEKQQEGLGDYFLDTLYSDIDSLTIYGGMHARYQSYYQMLSKRFPFAIYYKMDVDVVYIYAVVDCRKDPGWIEQHLSDAEK